MPSSNCIRELVVATRKTDVSSPLTLEASHSETKKQKERTKAYLKTLALIKREA